MQQHQNENLLFIREKIQEIKIALFKSEIDSELKLPNNVVQTLKVDDEGNAWFFTTIKNYSPGQIDKPFFAQLDYYKKGSDCRLHLSGEGSIVNDAGYDLCAIENQASEGFKYEVVLIRMKIMHAEFYDLHEKNQFAKESTWQQKIRTAINHWFVPQHRTYNFY
ncbi:hypothetical protein [Ferruginibacter sp.]